MQGAATASPALERAGRLHLGRRLGCPRVLIHDVGRTDRAPIAQDEGGASVVGPADPIGRLGPRRGVPGRQHVRQRVAGPAVGRDVKAELGQAAAQLGPVAHQQAGGDRPAVQIAIEVSNLQKAPPPRAIAGAGQRQDAQVRTQRAPFRLPVHVNLALEAGRGQSVAIGQAVGLLEGRRVLLARRPAGVPDDVQLHTGLLLQACELGGGCVVVAHGRSFRMAWEKAARSAGLIRSWQATA